MQIYDIIVPYANEKSNRRAVSCAFAVSIFYEISDNLCSLVIVDKHMKFDEFWIIAGFRTTSMSVFPNRKIVFPNLKKIMKKLVYMATAALAIMSMAACSKTNNGGTMPQKTAGQDEVYTGVLPAADCDGIRYTLRLDYDDDKADMDGDYKMVETYLGSDTVSASGIKDLASYRSEGDFTVIDKDGKKYLKLTKDARDSSADATSPLYFMVESDSTIVMVNAELEPSVTGALNYTLKRVK